MYIYIYIYTHTHMDVQCQRPLGDGAEPVPSLQRLGLAREHISCFLILVGLCRLVFLCMSLNKSYHVVVVVVVVVCDVLMYNAFVLF